MCLSWTPQFLIEQSVSEYVVWLMCVYVCVCGMQDEGKSYRNGEKLEVKERARSQLLVSQDYVLCIILSKHMQLKNHAHFLVELTEWGGVGGEMRVEGLEEDI